MTKFIRAHRGQNIHKIWLDTNNSYYSFILKGKFQIQTNVFLWSYKLDQTYREVCHNEKGVLAVRVFIDNIS